MCTTFFLLSFSPSLLLSLFFFLQSPTEYQKKSYATFSEHRVKDEQDAERRMAEKTKKLKELRKLASGIANAMSLSGGDADDDDDDEGGGSPAEKEEETEESEKRDDGWEAEDDAWDQAARISEANAATKPRRNAGISDDEEQQDVGGGGGGGGPGAPKVLFRDEHCASVEPESPEPIFGTLILTTTSLTFEPHMESGDMDSRALYRARARRSPLSQFRRIYLRSYCLVDNSFEVLLTGGRSAFYQFRVRNDNEDASTTNGKHSKHSSGSSSGSSSSKGNGKTTASASKQRRDALVSIILKKVTRKVRSWSQSPGQSPRRYFEASQITRAWQDRALSNFDYLMALNTMSGRSHNDLSQYPVFPWILTQYTEVDIDLSDPKNYRDLRKPVGALNAKRLEEFRERYNT